MPHPQATDRRMSSSIPAAVDRSRLDHLTLDSSVPANEKTTLLALIAHDGGCCYRALSTATGMIGSTLQRAVRGLEERGVARRERLDKYTWAVFLVDDEDEEPDEAHDGLDDEPEPCSVMIAQPVPTNVPKNEENAASPVTPAQTVPFHVPKNKEKNIAGPVSRARSRPVKKNKTYDPPRTSRPSPSDTPLAGDLIANGVWPSVARRLAIEHDEALVRAWIEQAQTWGGDLRNRGGWLRCALDQGWRLPVPVIANLSPEEIAERIAQAVWFASAPEERGKILHAAKANNSEFARQVRPLKSLPQLRDAVDDAVAVDFIRRVRLDLALTCESGQ